MNFFLDLSLIALIAITIFVCWHKGFIRSVLGVGKALLCVLVTYLFGTHVSAFLSEHWISGRVTQYVYERLLALFEAGVETFDIGVITDNLPSWVQGFLEKSGVDVGTILGNLTTVDTAGLQNLSQSLAGPIVKLISDIIGYAAVYLISLILFSVLSRILIKIADLPLIRKVDKILGCALGVCSAFIYASVYTLLLFAILSMIEGSNPNFAFHAAYDKTWVFRNFYNINIFRWIFGIG